MRILHVNWAPLWRGAEAGGGVNVYVQAMARGLAARGHTVSAVNAGYSYDLLGRPRLRHAVRHDGIDCYEIVNSPVMAPAFFNTLQPLQELREPQTERLFQRLLRRLQPQVVHFHNIEGFSAHCIALARESGARVIYSLHNYHPLCNQVNLLYQNRTPCSDFNAGARCLTCLPPPPPRWRHQLRRRLIYYARGLPGIQRLRPRVRRLNPQGSAPTAPVSTATAAQFRDRRRGMIEALNRSDLLLAVSEWVRQIYVKQGLDPTRVRVSHIGSAVAALGCARSPCQPRPDGAPLRLVFLGVAEPHKGLGLLLDALTEMGDAELACIDLALYARGVHALDERLATLRPRLARLTVQDGYRYADIPVLLADRDLGVVPPIWWDNAPQVVFELLALGVPVLGARIGGIPDFVRDAVNGLLFEPGDSRSLAAGLRRVLQEPELTEWLRAGIRPMKTIAEHTDELEAFYSACGN